jgi:hypothetical protein
MSSIQRDKVAQRHVNVAGAAVNVKGLTMARDKVIISPIGKAQVILHKVVIARATLSMSSIQRDKLAQGT